MLRGPGAEQVTTRHEFLRALHAVAEPRNYLEIGVSTGASMAQSRVPSIGIDPAPNVKRTLGSDVQIVQATSDDFFARPDPLEYLRTGRNPVRNLVLGRAPTARRADETTLDLAFIDGMHLAEFALRDFMNVERFASWSTVIVFDDMLPRSVDEAARDRHTTAWTGDVYKVIGILREHRPDLVVIPVNTTPTGVVVVLGADPNSPVLRDRYAAIEAATITPDPQRIPDAILQRRDAVDPDRLAAASFWSELVAARNRRAERSGEWERLRREVTAFTSQSSNLKPLEPDQQRPQPAPYRQPGAVRLVARRVIPYPVRAAILWPVRRVAGSLRALLG
jgi:predicted O-methyltransferase YrrM